MKKQDLGYVALKTIYEGIKIGSSSASTISNKINNATREAFMQSRDLLKDYVMSSDYTFKQYAHKGFLHILNKKYRMISIGTDNKVPGISKTALRHIAPDTLEASIVFSTPIVSAVPLNIYLKKTGSSYAFNHAQFGPLTFP